MKKTAFAKFALFDRRAGKFHALATDDSGVVLIAVLWICALIMWFAFQISAQTRLQGEDRLHEIRRSQALHLAIGGCYEALARIGQTNALQPLENPGNTDWQPDGRPRIVEYQTGVAVVIIEPGDTKLNVNMAQQAQLKEVLRKAGAPEADSEQLADRILDYIRPGDVPGLPAMGKNRHIQAGLDYIPFNGKLTSLDQLLLVPGISHQLFFAYDRGMDENNRDFPEICNDLVIPGRNSLFSLLSIYGNNTNMAQQLDEQQQPAALKTWRAGGAYRILSFGKSLNGPPSVGIWLEVSLMNESGKPYKILSRKVM